MLKSGDTVLVSGRFREVVDVVKKIGEVCTVSRVRSVVVKKLQCRLEYSGEDRIALQPLDPRNEQLASLRWPEHLTAHPFAVESIAIA